MRILLSAAYKHTLTLTLLLGASFFFSTAVLAEEEASTTAETSSAESSEEPRAISLPYGTSLDVLKAAIVPAAQATFEVFQPDGSTVANDLQDDYIVVVTAGDGVTDETYSIKFLPNEEATLISSLGEVDNDKNKIKALPFGTQLKDIRKAVTAAPQATFDVYQPDGKTLAGDEDKEPPRGVDASLQKGYKIIVTAGDKKTIKTYTIEFAANTETTATSEIGDVDHEANTISNIPYGTELKPFKEGIKPAPEAIFEIYIDAEKESRAGTLNEGYEVRVIAGDTTSQRIYKVMFAPNTDASVTAKDETVTIDEEKLLISNVPFNIKPKAFKELLRPAEQAIYEVYEDEGATRLATTDLVKGSSVMVIAGDTTTVKIYQLEFAPNKDADIKESVGTIDLEKKVITDIPFGTTVEEFKAALKTPEQSEFVIAGEDAKTAIEEFKGKKFYLTITAGDTSIFKQYKLQFAPNTAATVMTEMATVDDEANVIKDIPFGSDLKTLKASIKPAPQAVFEIYKSDEKTLAKDLVSGYKLIAVAGDTKTVKTYDLQMAPNTEATLTLSMDKLWELFKAQSITPVVKETPKEVKASGITAPEPEEVKEEVETEAMPDEDMSDADTDEKTDELKVEKEAYEAEASDEDTGLSLSLE